MPTKRALLVFTLFTIAASGQSEPPTPGPGIRRDADQRDTKKSVNDTNNHGTQSASSETQADKPSRGKETNPSQDNQKDFIVAIATVIIAAATIAQAVIYSLQTGHMKKALAETKDANRVATDALVKSMKKDRGWIFFDSCTAPGLGIGVPFRARATLKVFGQTPCRVISMAYRCHIQTSRPSEDTRSKFVPDLPMAPEFFKDTYGKDTRIVFPGAGLWLPPGGTPINMDADLETGPPTATQIGNIQAGSAFICIYGFVEYSDVFDDEHETRFCVVHKTSPGPPHFDVYGPPEYNRTIDKERQK